MLNWQKDWSDDSNTEWFAPSPITDEFGDPYYWKLSQKLENDKIVWYENHDTGILDETPCDFESLEEAKQYVESLDQEIKDNRPF